MTKTALLKKSTALEVVKSAQKLPAVRRKREYGDFDAWVASVDKLEAFVERVASDVYQLSDRFDWLEEPDDHYIDLERAKQQLAGAETNVRLAKERLPAFPGARKRLAKALRDHKWYDREELYEVKGSSKNGEMTLSRRVVSEQIALLLASYQNSRPGTPKVFGKMLIEEVYAYRPNACVLESACRRVRRQKSFPPSIAEVLLRGGGKVNWWFGEIHDTSIEGLHRAALRLFSTFSKPGRGRLSRSCFRGRRLLASRNFSSPPSVRQWRTEDYSAGGPATPRTTVGGLSLSIKAHPRFCGRTSREVREVPKETS